MKKLFYMWPRQSGKTTEIIKQYKENPNETLIVTHSENMAKHITDLLHQNGVDSVGKNDVIGFNRLINNYLSGIRKYKHIIFDEYMFFDNKRVIYNAVEYLNPETLTIYSSSNKQYNKKLLEFIKKRKGIETFNSILNKISIYNELAPEWHVILGREFDELYYSFLTDNDIILDDSKKSPLLVNSNNIKFLDSMQYEIEIENKWLIDN